jgi:hypothetical protein
MRYRSFILRVWQRNELNGSEWAGSLESIQAPGAWRFHTLEQLVALLRQQAEADTPLQRADREAAAPQQLPDGTQRRDREGATREE